MSKQKSREPSYRHVFYTTTTTVGRVAQAVQWMATGWTVRGSNPGGGEIFRTCPDRTWGPPSPLHNGYRVFPGVKSGLGVTLTPHLLLVPWSRKGRAIPLLPLWTVRPVQASVPVQGCAFYNRTLPHTISNDISTPQQHMMNDSKMSLRTTCVWRSAKQRYQLAGVP